MGWICVFLEITETSCGDAPDIRYKNRFHIERNPTMASGSLLDYFNDKKKKKNPPQ